MYSLGTKTSIARSIGGKHNFGNALGNKVVSSTIKSTVASNPTELYSHTSVAPFDSLKLKSKNNKSHLEK